MCIVPMRILLHLISQQDAPYDNDYHYHLQSLFYRLMLESGRKDVHDRLVYKHFCFSNIFPFEEKISSKSRYNLIFSTPDEELCTDVFKALESRISAGGESSILRLGDLRFQIDQVSRPFRMDFSNDSFPSIRTRSATPIIIRIPKWRYEDYGIQSDRPFEFWRESISLEAFVKQVRDGMEKKLSEYKGLESYPRKDSARRDEFGDDQSQLNVPEILSYRFLKSVSKPVTIKGERQQAIGSLWEFEFSPQSQKESNNLEFALDSGLGERNSLGFGFMNII
jgi:CRISPR-associated endoribonuclease Cas6